MSMSSMVVFRMPFSFAHFKYAYTRAGKSKLDRHVHDCSEMDKMQPAAGMCFLLKLIFNVHAGLHPVPVDV